MALRRTCSLMFCKVRVVSQHAFCVCFGLKPGNFHQDIRSSARSRRTQRPKALPIKMPILLWSSATLIVKESLESLARSCSSKARHIRRSCSGDLNRSGFEDGELYLVYVVSFVPLKHYNLLISHNISHCFLRPHLGWP